MYIVNKLHHSANVKHNFNIIIYFLHAAALQSTQTALLAACNFVHKSKEENFPRRFFASRFEIKVTSKRVVESNLSFSGCMQMQKLCMETMGGGVDAAADQKVLFPASSRGVL